MFIAMDYTHHLLTVMLEQFSFDLELLDDSKHFLFDYLVVVDG